MAKSYLGHLSAHDPLYHYLRYEMLPQLGQSGEHARFRVFRLGGSKEVYLYEEQSSHARLIGKFFAGTGTFRGDVASRHMEQEYHNLQHIRAYGMTGHPHYVVRPLGCNGYLNSLLVEEYCSGKSLSAVISSAISDGRQDELFAKLTALAYFLATLHNRTANGAGVDFHHDCVYLDHLVRKLYGKHFIGAGDVGEFSWLRDRWREQARMWEDQQVLVHGDATPSNFLFGDGLSVIAIDLEGMRRADRVFDVGRIAGELQHFFMQATGNKYAAEPFIGHFLWEYACHFPDRHSAFRSISGRVAFQMGITLLRIARNNWVDHAYRRRLIDEARITLRTA